jgi:23S rRNA (guanosine2251-2'-O)-methyltransferase
MMRIIIGKNPVFEAIKSNKKISRIYMTDRFKSKTNENVIELLKEKNINFEFVNSGKLDDLAKGDNHQGILAMAEDFRYSTLDEVIGNHKIANKNCILLLLDGITDIHNLGAIIRSAECAGVSGVIIPERRSAQINDVVSKTSAGALEYMPVVQVKNLNATVDELKKRGFWIYGADMNGDAIFTHEKYEGAIALVIGSEGKGLGRLLREKCDKIIEIPMFGRVNSLNASCAATVLIYEVVRQRGLT